MTVEIQLNGTALSPQPAEVNWSTEIIQQKLNGVDATGAYQIVTLRAPVETGGTANWNWASLENQELTSVQLPRPYTTMRQSDAVTYNSGVVTRKIQAINAPPGGLVRDVEMQVLVVI